MDPSDGFPPVARTDAEVLILGSLPGQRSLQAQQYYGHPRNAFWPILKETLGVDGSYAQRCTALVDRRIALWDVLRASVRPGSLDSAIRIETAVVNDFADFLQAHDRVRRILFNGQKARQLFDRLVVAPDLQSLTLATLPSTSPAYAAMPFSGKLTAWREVLLAPV